MDATVTFPADERPHEATQWASELWDIIGKHAVNWTARTMFRDRCVALLTGASPATPFELAVALIEAHKQALAANNPQRAAYSIIEKLDMPTVRAAMEHRRRAHDRKASERTAPEAQYEARRAYVRALIQDAMNRPARPSHPDLLRMQDWEAQTHLQGWIERCIEWDKANAAAVEKRLDEITNEARRMYMEKVPMQEIRAWSEARAREVQP